MNIGLAVFDMFDIVGWDWDFVIISLSVALLFEYQAPHEYMQVGAYGLLCGWVCASNPSWKITATNIDIEYVRELVLYELLQSVEEEAGIGNYVGAGRHGRADCPGRGLHRLRDAHGVKVGHAVRTDCNLLQNPSKTIEHSTPLHFSGPLSHRSRSFHPAARPHRPVYT